MSWNPFKKKDNAEPGTDPQASPEPPPPPADTPVQSPVPVPPVDDDDTQPIMDAAPVTEQVTPVRAGNGVRLERVEVDGAAGPSGVFLRLVIEDNPALAAGIERVFTLAPDEVTGFRNRLVHPSGNPALAFDPVGNTLAAALAGPGDEGLPTAADLLAMLDILAGFAGALAGAGLFQWPLPRPEGIGLVRTGDGLAPGLQGWRAQFCDWDGLLPVAVDPTAPDPGPGNLVRTFLPGFDRLAEAATTRGLGFSRRAVTELGDRLEALADTPGLTYDGLRQGLAGLRPVFTGCGLTDNGMRRDHNEDAFLCFNIDQASSCGNQFQLAVVADGMGGHASGEVASSLALDLLRQQLMLGLLTPRSQPVPTSKLPEQLEAVIPAIDRALTQRAEMEPALGGMGTTLAGIAVLRQSSTLAEGGRRVLGEETAAVFHVGDSRAYSFGPTGLRRLTRDHSFVQGLVDSGSITPEEAFNHPRKNVITRCLGGGQSESTPDVNCFTPGPGEVLLVASDGLSDALRDTEIEEVLVRHGDAGLAEVAEALIDAANHAGGPDNITVLLVECRLDRPTPGR